MASYLLDTNIIRSWYDGNATVKANADARDADSPLHISVITRGEIEYGHALNPHGAGPKRTDYIEFVKKRLPWVLVVSKHTAEPYGHIRAMLINKFPPSGGWSKQGKKRAEQLYDPAAARELGIDENDLWIVAQAVERNLVLVTSDKMPRIREAVCEIYPHFRLEDWTKEERST